MDAAGLPGCARLELAQGAVPLNPQEAVFEAMLAGWARQQRSRFLREDATIGPRAAVVRRLAGFAGQYPWEWEPAEAEAFISHLRSGARPVVASTARVYEGGRLDGIRCRFQALAFDHACPRYDTHGWHVFRHDGARPDNRAAADGHSGGDRGGSADPDVVLDDDRGVSDGVVAFIEFDGVAGGAQGHPGADHDPVADRDAAEVEEEASLVDEHLLAEGGSEAVVTVEGRQDRQ